MSSFTATSTGKDVVEAFTNEIAGKTFLITGPSAGGIGAEIAKSLATAKPKLIILAGRDETKIAPVMEEIRKSASGPLLKFVKLDLANLSSVRSAAAEINATVDKIDVLINNAGIISIKEYTKTVDGFENHFATNHLGHFLLTSLIVDKLGSGSRIVNTASMGYQVEELRFDDWNFSDGKTFNAWVAYGQSKTANFLFTLGLATKLKSRGVLSFTVNPGLILETQLLANVNPEMLMEGFNIATAKNNGVPVEHEMHKTLQQGCSTSLVAALSPQLKDSSGAFINDCQVSQRQLKDYVNPLNADKLWSLSEKLVGLESGL